jgi:hypothetical protein
MADGDLWLVCMQYNMAGLGSNPVQGFRTLRDLHWVEFTF